MRRLRHIFAVGIQALVAAGVLLLLIANLRLYLPAPPPPGRVAGEVWPELRYVRAALDGGAGAEMQALFPEGDFFTYVLYGLAWVNAGLQLPVDSPQRAEALEEARRAWRALGEPERRAPFRSARALAPEYGVFYAGWRNYLLAGILLLQRPGALDPAELQTFEERCAEIAAAFEAHGSPFLPAYPGMAWPVDSFPALLSLQTHARLVDDRYVLLLERWLVEAEGYRDPQTGLLPHRVDARTGAPLEGARATSQVLILRFLLELDEERGQEHYRRFRERYVVMRSGIPGVLEYPVGLSGRGDVDSGPLIRGVSLSATALMIGTARVYGDAEVSEAIWHAGELLGVPVRCGGTKRYALGLLPVGDAFAVWSKTAHPWLTESPAATYPPLIPRGWRLRLHALSLGLLLPALGVLLLIRRRREEPAAHHDLA
ncbi:MAG: hypothetical protein ACLFU8_12830 [Anaerolineales bacterium]